MSTSYPPTEDMNELSRSERAAPGRTPGDARLRALLEGMLDAVVTIDACGKIEEASNSVHDVFGYEPHELIGENIRMLMPEPHHSAHDGYLDNYRRTGHTGILGRTREFDVLRKGGETIVIELSVSRVDLPDDEPLFIGSFRDVTARKEADKALADSERRFRAIFDQEFQFVGLLRPDGTLIEVNRAALESAGIAREVVIGKPFWTTPWWAHSEEAQARIRSAVEEAATGTFVRFETDYRGGDGEEKWVDFSLKPVKDDEGNVVLLLPEGRDITQLKKASRRENAMLRSLAEIGESAAVLVHEIKNPITAVNLALRAVADRLDQDQKTVLEDLAGRMQGLERTMRRTLGFVRPLECKLELLDPNTLLAQVEALMRPQLEAAGVALESSVAADVPTFHGDPMLLEHLFSNLIQNAIEACSDRDDGGRVRIVAHTAAKAIRFEVEDDGPGIADDMKDDLFRPFATGRSEGTGLGLALCRKIVDAHGGTIEAERGELGGARFVIDLPLNS
jgi:two-component system sensor histidine kinase/response regulator